MRELLASTLVGLTDESEKNIFIEDFERLTMEGAREALKEAYRVLGHGGVVEFAVLNFGWVVERYMERLGTDAEMGRVLFDPPRKAVWDDRTMAKCGLLVGWYKVWCGNVSEYPEHMMYVKMLKWSRLSVERFVV